MNAPGQDNPAARTVALDDIDRSLIRATQGGLPLLAKPYEAVAERLGIAEAEVIRRLGAMLDNGVIRRIGAVPNHYALGYTANGMSVWEVQDAAIDMAGERVGALDFVTHCYRRPRCLPDWPYNLFAMVHGGSREEVLARVNEIRVLLAHACPGAVRAHDVLFSTAILKKTGLRLRD